MKKSHIGIALFICLMVILASAVLVWGQAGFNDDRVMLQGFYWESSRHGYPDKFPQFGSKKWYAIVREQAGKIREGRFDLIWLPPPSHAGDFSAGYDPREYFDLNNSYGSFNQHQAMLRTLLENGIEPVADIVINHRNGSSKWADFKNPDWGTWAITRDDEAFTDPASEVYNTKVELRGAPEERLEYAPQRTAAYTYGSFRDIDHTNPRVRRDLMRYLLQLKSLGYRGWRYDMVHGYHARWVAQYNRASRPTFAVGEYDWDKQGEQRGWAWYSATTPGDLHSASDVFDFTTFYSLKNNKGNYRPWYGFGQGLGLVGDTTDGLPWKNRAVTFLENHDTGYRTNEDGTPQKDHGADSFANNWEVEQGYAYILTHPGVPCVFWKHYFDWGNDLQNKIKALINARKVAGVNAGSMLYLQDNAREKGIYAAMVQGSHGQLYVRIGGDDSAWQPFFSNYSNYREYAQGAGWKVWVATAGNLAVQQAPLKKPFPVPEYRSPEKIDILEEWLK